jgi:hypothetical protein
MKQRSKQDQMFSVFVICFVLVVACITAAIYIIFGN